VGDDGKDCDDDDDNDAAAADDDDNNNNNNNHTGKVTNQGRTQNNHTGHCTHLLRKILVWKFTTITIPPLERSPSVQPCSSVS
jgi:hypothetical protein